MLKKVSKLLFGKEAAKKLAGTRSTKADPSSMAGPSLADRTAKMFSEMEESRNDRISDTLTDFIKSKSSTPQ